MMRYVVGSVVLSGVLITSAAPMSAQSMVAAATAAQHDGYFQQTPSAKPSVLDRTVSVDLSGMTLDRALQEVQEKSNVQIIYSPQLIPAGRKVSVSATSVTLRAVLDDLLRGTSVTSHLSPKGQVMLVPSASGAQQAEVITGRVLDAKTKQPVVGARISMDDTDAVVESGSDGTFRLEASAGQHRVTVKAVGFTRQVKTVIVTEGEAMTIEIILEPSASVLDEVVVTGSVVATERKAIPTPITVITAEDIERRGITRIEQLFRGEVPGVVALDQGVKRYSSELGSMQASKVYVRGASSMDGLEEPSPNSLKTYIDGVEVLDPNLLGVIDPQSIERIEIIGPPQASTLYGSGAMGGVMQIFTKRSAKDRFSELQVGLKYGILENSVSNGKTPMHTHTANVSGGSGAEFSYSVNTSYNYSGQWRPAFFTRSIGGSVGVTYRRDKLLVGGSALFTSTKNGTTDSWMLANVFMAESGEWDVDNVGGLNRRFSVSSGQTVSFNVDYQPLSWWQHHLVLGRTGNVLEVIPEAPRFVTAGDSLYNSVSSSGNRSTVSYNTTYIQKNVLRGMNYSLTFGANGSWGTRTRVDGCMVSKFATAYVECRSSRPVGVSKPLDGQAWGGFGQLRVGLFDQIFVTMGLRGERNPSYGRQHKVDWTPTHGMAYAVSFNDFTVKLLGAYGRATRAPLQDQKEAEISNSASYVVRGYVSRYSNPALTPEYSSGPQGGVELYYGNIGSLTINHYRQTVTDLIQSVVVDSFFTQYARNGQDVWVTQSQYRNVAKIRQQGWEGTGSFNVRMITVKGTYSWNDSRVLESKHEYWRPGQSFWGVPSHFANLTIGYAGQGTSVVVTANYVGAQLGRYTSSFLPLYERSQSRMKMYVGRARSVPEWYGFPLDGYIKYDLAIVRRMTSSLSATVNIINAGDNYSSDAGFGSPTLGRQTLLGLSLRYPLH